VRRRRASADRYSRDDAGDDSEYQAVQQVPAHDPTLDTGKELHATTPEGVSRRHYRRCVIREIQHDFSLVCELSRRVMQDIGGRVLGLYTRMRMSSTDEGD
jgi:hypothetical protein